MASITCATIGQRVGQALGIYKSHTTTGAGETDGTTLVCSTMDYADNELQDKYVKITSGATQVTRKIRKNFYDEGQIVPYAAFGAQIATAVTFEIHDFDPSCYINCINDAIRDAYPYLCNHIVNTESIVGRNVLPTAVFDDWAVATYPDYMTLSTATAAKESTTVLYGTYSLKLLTAAGTCYYSSNNWKPLLSLKGQSVDYYRWVNTAAASNARIYITTITQGGTTTTTSSDNHSGNGKWELIKVSASAPNINTPSNSSDLAEIRIGCQTQTTDAAYFDKGYVGSTIDEYLVPGEFEKVTKVSICNSWYEFETRNRRPAEFEQRDKEGVKYLWIKNAVAESKLELKGYGPFTALSADTSPIILDTEWQRAIVFGAIANLLRGQATSFSQSMKEPMALADFYEKKFNEFKRTSDKRSVGVMSKWM